MNIFYLDPNPIRAAMLHCDVHVRKMILESAQMLCAAHEEGSAPYKRTHYNHPCTKWVREDLGNYLWLCRLGLALCEEYTARTNKVHKTQEVLQWCRDNVPTSLTNKTHGWTKPPCCMPDEFIVSLDPVVNYTLYYGHKLSTFSIKQAAYSNRQGEAQFWHQFRDIVRETGGSL